MGAVREQCALSPVGGKGTVPQAPRRHRPPCSRFLTALPRLTDASELYPPWLPGRALLTARRVLRVARGLLSELHSGSEAKLAVHVGEVRLHGARRHEEPGGDLLVGKPFGHQAGYVAFGGS